MSDTLTDLLVTGDPELSFAPRVEVQPPPYSPFKYGLFSVSERLGFGADSEQNGVWAEVDPYGTPDVPTGGPDAFAYADGCTPAGNRAKDIPPGSFYSLGDPFTVYAGYKCTAGSHTDEEGEARARRALDLGEERAIEKLLVDGQTANGVSWTSPLDSTNAVNATSHANLAGSMGAAEAVLLKQYGGEGVIQVPVALFEYLSGFGMLELDGGSWRTRLGTRISVNRYLDGTLDSSVPVILSGPIVLRRGPVQSLGSFKEAFDRSTNTVTRIVERTYVVLTDFPVAS